jgi:ParB family chromosome partitioning protein
MYSEKAWAYRIKMEALNHNGVKADMHSVEVLVKQTGESKNQIFRLIRLTELVNDLLDKVDTHKLSYTAAVELSYLSQIEQTTVSATMEKYEVKPSLSQAQRLKKMKQMGELTIEKIDEIFAETKKPTEAEPKGITSFREFFPMSYTQSQIELAIIQLLRERRNAG